jgi:hypothetical protein
LTGKDRRLAVIRNGELSDGNAAGAGIEVWELTRRITATTMGRPPTAACSRVSAQSAHEVIRSDSAVAQDRADTANAGYVGLGSDDGTLIVSPSGPPCYSMPGPTPEETP